MGVVCSVFVFVGCVVQIWITMVVFTVVLVASVDSLLLDSVSLFLVRLVFGIHVFIFCVFGGDFCFPFILYFGCVAVWGGGRVCCLLGGLLMRLVSNFRWFLITSFHFCAPALLCGRCVQRLL